MKTVFLLLTPVGRRLLTACASALPAGPVLYPADAFQAGTPNLVQFNPSERMRSVIEQMDASRTWAALDSYPKLTDWPHWVGDEPQTECYTRWSVGLRSDQPLYVVALRQTGLVAVRRAHGMDGSVEHFLVPVAPALFRASTVDLPDPGVGRAEDSSAAKSAFLRRRAGQHKWKRGMSLPTELKHVGLRPDQFWCGMRRTLMAVLGDFCSAIPKATIWRSVPDPASKQRILQDASKHQDVASSLLAPCTTWMPTHRW